MSHVDDGTLHAYLDGALSEGEMTRDEVEGHLRVCADCRVRMDAAFLDREGAREILGLLAPDEIRTPPFEEMLARRKAREALGRSGAGGGPGSGGWGMRPVQLAWAASILVALGGGWMARGAMFLPPASDVAAEGRAWEIVARGTQGGVVGSDAGDAGQLEAGEEAAVRDRAEASSEVAAAPGTAESSAGPRTVASRTTPGAADPEPTPTTAAPTEPTVAEAPAPATDPVWMAREPSLRALPGLAAPASGGADLRYAPGPAMDPDAPLEMRFASAVGADLFDLEARATEAGAWIPVSPAEAARSLGHPPLDLEGLPWERMEMAPVAGGVLVRTDHPRPDGTWLEMVQAREDLLLGPFQLRSAVPEPEVVGPRRAAAPQAASSHLALGLWVRDGLVGALRGPGDRAELEELLARVR